MDPVEILGDFLFERPASVSVLDSRTACFAELEQSLPPSISEALSRQGIEQLYSHQARAIDKALRGRDVMVVTGTSSGKTLCYNVPVLSHCVQEPMARAMYLFPTKALAQDQMGKLEELSQGLDVRVATYDGDTERSHRGGIRKEANIVLTNPDMLHLGILPQHELWTKFFRSLRTIVVDEAHTYRGVFGGHVSWVLRRLLRMCEWHGSYPQVIACSATVANPQSLFFDLVGRSAELVDEDGSPAGRKSVYVVSPVVDERSGKTSSPNLDTARLLADFSAKGIKTMAFCRARVSVELVIRTARRFMEGKGLDPAMIDSYRGGYSPEERRKIERQLFSGELRGLATTNAMELGVDVGGLDAVILNGYPGRISSFWQQVGRAGRSRQDSLAVMLTHADPLEQFLAQRPELILDGRVEPTVASTLNPFIALSQLRCAAYERPIGEEEVARWDVKGLVDDGVEGGDFHEARGRFFYPSHDPPAGKVNIRGASSDQVRLLVEGEVLGEMEYWRALRNAHPGAVYLHRGEIYVVKELDLAKRVAVIQPEKVDYFTMPIVQHVVEPQVSIEKVERFGLTVDGLGLIVTSSVTGFRRMKLDGQQVLDETALELPPQSFETTGLRFDFSEQMLPIIEPRTMEVVHSLEHILAALAPLRAGCDRRDLGSAWYAITLETMRSAVFLFDEFPGGLGFSLGLVKEVDDLLRDAETLLAGCDCEDGCPLCILSSHCESGNEPLSKRETRRVLQAILSGQGQI